MTTRKSETSIAGKRHEAVAAVLRGRIVDGSWGGSFRLPSLDDLAAEFQVSNITVRQALARLEVEGLLRRRQGVGTFVNEIASARRNLLMKFATCWGPIVETGDHVELQMLESRVHSQSVLLGSDAALAEPADSYRYLRRLSLENGAPFSVLEAEIDLRIYKRAAKAFEKERAVLGVLDTMTDLKVSQARQYMSIEVADIEQARLLGVALGSPIGKIKRLVIDDEGIAIALVVITYPGPLVKLEMSLSNAIN